MLGKNFRSAPAVTGCVNFFFSQLMSSEIGEVDYNQEEALSPGASFPEEIEAWQFGPVVREVYRQYCGFGAMPIRMQYDVRLTLDYMRIIDSTVEKKRQLNPWDLVSDTHSRGKAWDLIYRNGAGDFQVIPQELIRSKG